VGGHGDRGDRGQHQPDGQEADRTRDEAEVLGGEAEGRRIEDRRQEDQEDQLRRDLDVRRERQQPDDQAAQHERHGVRHPPPLGGQRQQDHGRQEQNEEVDLTHRGSFLAARTLAPAALRPGGA